MTSTSIRAAGALFLWIAVLAGFTPACAAPRCTLEEINEMTKLLKAPGTASCDRWASQKNSSIQQMCSACRTQYKVTLAIDRWIAKHPGCAAELQASRLHRTGHDFMGIYKKYCVK